MKAFINLLGIYPVGTLVVLDTFELAVVCAANPRPDVLLSRPIVLISAMRRETSFIQPPKLTLRSADSGRPVSPHDHQDRRPRSVWHQRRRLLRLTKSISGSHLLRATSARARLLRHRRPSGSEAAIARAAARARRRRRGRHRARRSVLRSARRWTRDPGKLGSMALAGGHDSRQDTRSRRRSRRSDVPVVLFTYLNPLMALARMCWNARRPRESMASL